MSFIRYWAPVVLLCVTIFLLSGLTPDQLDQFNIPLKDKLAHVIAYGALGFLVARAASGPLKGQKPPLSWNQFQRPFLFAVAFCLAYGIFDEFRQSFTPGREVEFLDLVADFVGGILGGILAFQYRRIISKYELRSKLRSG